MQPINSLAPMSQVGKTIILNEGFPFLITGVIETLPENSHLKFDFLLSLTTGYSAVLGIGSLAIGTTTGFTHMLSSKNGIDRQSTEKQINKFTVEKDNVQKENKTHNEYHLQPLTSIHLDSALGRRINSSWKPEKWYTLWA